MFTGLGANDNFSFILNMSHFKISFKWFKCTLTMQSTRLKCLVFSISWCLTEYFCITCCIYFVGSYVTPGTVLQSYWLCDQFSWQAIVAMTLYVVPMTAVTAACNAIYCFLQML